jgi:hypothetical protein
VKHAFGFWLSGVCSMAGAFLFVEGSLPLAVFFLLWGVIPIAWEVYDWRRDQAAGNDS